MFISLPNLKKKIVTCSLLTKKLVWIYLEIKIQQSKERNCLSMVNITDFIASLKCIKKLTQCHMSYGKVFVMQTMATLLLNKRFKGLKGHLRIRALHWFRILVRRAYFCISAALS